MTTSTRWLASLAAAPMLIAACSDDDDDVASTTTAAATTTAAVTTTDAAGQTTVGTDASTDADSSDRPSSFSISISEPAALDPALSSEVEGAQVIRLLFETLTTLSPELEVVPAAAESWSVVDDGVTWTFELDDGAFSDGAPVTAEDFVFAFARAADPDLASVSRIKGFRSSAGST